MNGLVALITGGASGLGLACIHRFLKQGISHVHFCDLPTSKGEEIVETMDSSLVTYHPVDVTNDQEVEKMFKQIQEKQSKLNCLVQCAGIGVAFRCYNINKRSMHSMEEFNRVLNVNVVGTFNVLRRACHIMADNQPDTNGQRGVIINTSSIAAYEGQIGQVAYSAASGALASMTLPLARDLASIGIRVCTILPGVFDQTKMVEPLSEKGKQLLAMMVSFPSRLGLPDDYARLAQNIIENSYLNGENVRLDGAIRMPPLSMSDTVKFRLTNGDVFGIYRRTLEKYPNSFLTRLIDNEANSSFHSSDADNSFVIDEDPMIFSSILTYYRCGVLTIMHDDLRQAIIDKYMLPQVHSACSSTRQLSTNDEPMYVHIGFEHASSTSAQTRPLPSQIPALHGCPFILTHTNSYRSKDPIEIANYLACNRYTMEQIDINTRSILMKRKN